MAKTPDPVYLETDMATEVAYAHNVVSMHDEILQSCNFNPDDALRVSASILCKMIATVALPGKGLDILDSILPDLRTGIGIMGGDSVDREHEDIASKLGPCGDPRCVPCTIDAATDRLTAIRDSFRRRIDRMWRERGATAHPANHPPIRPDRTPKG